MSTVEKFGQMLFAVALFAVVMILILGLVGYGPDLVRRALTRNRQGTAPPPPKQATGGRGGGATVASAAGGGTATKTRPAAEADEVYERPGRFKRSLFNSDNWAIWGFLGPAAVLLLIGLVIPAIRTVYQSFLDRNAQEFVGLANYVEMFTNPNLLIVLRNTAIWVIVTPFLATAIGLAYAVVIDRAKGEALAKSLIFLPMAISFVGASIIWRFMYEFRPLQGEIQQIGLFNQILVWLGQEPYQFLIRAPWNTFFILAVMVWVQAGFAMVILSAAIKGISADIIEAARLDGVSGWGMFRHVTVPSIRPAIVVVLTTITIATLKVFDIVRTMTGGQFNTSVIANEFYEQTFRLLNQGLGAALAVFLFILVIPVLVYNVRTLRKAENR